MPKSKHQIPGRVRSAYEFIKAHGDQYSVPMMCRVLEAAGPTIQRELVLDAVLMAVRRRRPRRTMIHSDQGTQFGSDAWRRFCRSNHLGPSMSRKANCWDNAVTESFFGSLKEERIKKQILQEPRSRDERRGRLYRGVLQFHPTSQLLERRQRRPIRSRPQAAAKRCPLNPGNSSMNKQFPQRPGDTIKEAYSPL
jgi:transposase InsO family protein